MNHTVTRKPISTTNDRATRRRHGSETRYDGLRRPHGARRGVGGQLLRPAPRRAHTRSLRPTVYPRRRNGHGNN